MERLFDKPDEISGKESFFSLYQCAHEEYEWSLQGGIFLLSAWMSMLIDANLDSDSTRCLMVDNGCFVRYSFLPVFTTKMTPIWFLIAFSFHHGRSIHIQPHSPTALFFRAFILLTLFSDCVGSCATYIRFRALVLNGSGWWVWRIAKINFNQYRISQTVRTLYRKNQNKTEECAVSHRIFSR